MKVCFGIAMASSALLFSCSKSSSGSASTENWLLIQKTVALGPGERVITPSKDSSVLLALDPGNGQYTAELNDQIISQGSYSINTDTAYSNTLYLELNNFTTTGIFGLFMLEQIGANDQVLSVFNGLFMHISSDTLILSSAVTSGGFVSYLFIKK